MIKPTLFIDMDGVLVDFDKGYHHAFGYTPTKIDDNVDWALVKAHNGFYANLPAMEDFDVLWQGVAQYNPIILTGVPKEVPDSTNDKRAWVDKHIGKDQPMIACLSKEKSLHMRNKGDIMIDDWDKYRQLWLDLAVLRISRLSSRLRS